MQPQRLCLKWNNHTANLLSVLGGFQQKDILVDVTITCEGQNIKAHKMILSACSPYFQNIFLENPCQHPIIIINGMKYDDITAILNFMYKGEVNVSQEKLSSFLQAAEALKVKGLAEVCGEKNSALNKEVQQSEQTRPQRTDTPPRKRRNRKRSLSDSNRSDEEQSSRKHREPSSPEVHELSGDESFTGDNSNGTKFNSTPQVPQNVYRSHQSSSTMGGEDEEEYEVEPSKLLEQTLTTETISMNNSNSDQNLRIERIIGNAQEIESSSMHEPESPPDIKPIIDYGESSAGPSEGSMMMYNEQSQPGPSNMQDGSLIDNSHAQEDESDVSGFCEVEASFCEVEDDEAKRTLYMCSDCDFFSGLLRGIKTHKKSCTGKKSSGSKGGKISAVTKKLFVCSDCEFTTTEESEIKTHDKASCVKGKKSIACQTEEPAQNLTSTPLVVIARPSSGTSAEDQDATGGKRKESVSCQTDDVKFVEDRKKDERIDCSYCSYSTTNKHNFKLHLKIHTGEKPHQCTYCEKAFTLKSNLTSHIRTHTGQRPYTCDVCSKSFATKSVLDRHKIRWHTMERPYVCDICFMGFKFKPDLGHHKKTHNFG